MTDTLLLLSLLKESTLFDKQTKQLIKASMNTHVLPDRDQAELLLLLKQEKNIDAILEQKKAQLLAQLRQEK